MYLTQIEIPTYYSDLSVIVDIYLLQSMKIGLVE